MIAELKERWKAQSPVFWTKIKKFWYWVGGVSLVIIGMSSDEIQIIQQVFPPEFAKYTIKISHYAAAIAAISALQTKFTKMDPNCEPPKP